MRRRAPRRPIEGLSDPVGYRRRRWSRSDPAGASLKRDLYVFSRRRRSFGSKVLRASIVFAALALGAWLLTRPSTAIITAQPPDAVIKLAGREATGSLTVEGLKPGDHQLRVERKGFATHEATLRVRRLRAARAEVALAPLPQALKVVCEAPGGAIVTVEAGGRSVRGEGSVACTVPAGLARVMVARTGYNPFTRQMFVDSAATLTVRLDPEGQLVSSLGIIECAGAPKGVALTPDGGEAWATILDGPPSIQIFDPRTGKLKAEIDLGEHGAVEVVFDRAGKRAYTTQMETARVFEIDTASRRVIRTFDTGSPRNWSKVVALSPDEKTLYVSNWSGDSVSVIDLASGDLLDVIAVSDTPRGLYPSGDGRSLWVASFDTGVLERVDLESGGRQTVFRSPGGALRHLVADEKTGRLFISDMARDCIWVTEMATGRTKRFATTDRKPNTIALSPDGRVLFVSCRGANNPASYNIPGPEWGSVLLFDSSTGAGLDAIVGGNQCTALTVSADGALLVFSDFLDARIRSYEVPPFSTLASGGGGRWSQHAAGILK